MWEREREKLVNNMKCGLFVLDFIIAIYIYMHSDIRLKNSNIHRCIFMMHKR